MSTEHIAAMTPEASSQTVKAPSASDATTAGAVASTHGSETLSAASKIGSLAELKKKAPKMYNEMMKSMAWNICSEMKKQQERLKEAMDEGRRRH